MPERTITLRLEIDGREVEARLKRTDDLVKLLLGSFERAGEEGSEATERMRKGLDAIEAEIQAGTIRSLAQARQATALLEQAFEQATDDETRARIAGLSAQVQGLSRQMLAGSGAISGGFNPAAMQLVRLAQDAQFGFLGMANNLQELIFQLTQAARSGQGMAGALRGLGASLLGPAGVLAGVSLLIGFAPQIIGFFRRLGEGSSLSAEELTKLREEFESLAGVPLPDDMIEALERLAGGAEAAAARVRAFRRGFDESVRDLSTEDLERIRRGLERVLEPDTRGLEIVRRELDELERRIEILRRLRLGQFVSAQDAALVAAESRSLEELQQRLEQLRQEETRMARVSAERRAALDAVNDALDERRAQEEAAALAGSVAAQVGVDLTAGHREREKAAKAEAEALERLRAAREALADARASETEALRLEVEAPPEIPEPDLGVSIEDSPLVQERIALEEAFAEALRRSSEATEAKRRALVEAIEAEIAYRETLVATLPATDEEYQANIARLRELRAALEDLETRGAAAFERAAEAIAGGARLTIGEIEALERALQEYLATLADPAQIASVQATLEALRQLREGMTATGTEVIDTSQQMAQAVQAALTGMTAQLAETIGLIAAQGAAAAEGNAFILQALADLAITVGRIAVATGTAVEAIKTALTSLFGAGAIVAGVALIALGSLIKGRLARAARAREAEPPRFAEGGMVEGPGGPEDDRVPALLSAGEYVVRARAVRRVLPVLEAINTDPGSLRVTPALQEAAVALLRGDTRTAERLVGIAGGADPDERLVERFARGGLVEVTGRRRVEVDLSAGATAAGRALTASLMAAPPVARQEVAVRVTGRLTGEGRDLVAVIDETERLVGRAGA